MKKNMSRKKTIAVKTILNEINALLALPTISQDAKQVLCSHLEEVLMETKNYRGFNDLKWRQEGCQKWEEQGRPEDKTPFMGEEYTRVYF